MRKQRHPSYPAQTGCSVEATLEVIGGKWKGVILYHLMTSGTLRFSEIQRLKPDVSPRMLTAQLRELETDGVVVRTVYPVVPPRVEYSLSEAGMSLKPLILAMQQWGDAYVRRSDAPIGRRPSSVQQAPSPQVEERA